eukprot:m.1647423 g.1647423  ORF g.1647423 m.1647423 type:complete len:87 (-) comp74905_c0_seq1:20-280(-)
MSVCIMLIAGVLPSPVVTTKVLRSPVYMPAARFSTIIQSSVRVRFSISSHVSFMLTALLQSATERMWKQASALEGSAVSGIFSSYE